MCLLHFELHIWSIEINFETAQVSLYVIYCDKKEESLYVVIKIKETQNSHKDYI